MIKVYDDLLPPALVDRIEKTLTSDEFYWYALDNISLGGQQPKREFEFPKGWDYVETSGMTKPFWRDDLWFDPYDMYMMSRMVVDYFSDASGIPLNRLIRVKGNLLTPNPNPSSNEKSIHYPHIDFYNDHHVLVYYVNDSDGDTILFNEKWKPEDNGNLVPLTVKQTITPKRGRIAYFNGLHYHTSQSPNKSSERIIININFA
jgi:hypothetical protein